MSELIPGGIYFVAIEGDTIRKINDREYECDYVVSANGSRQADLYYEWSGVIDGGRILLDRKLLSAKWI
jgi:hypothetical protein